MIRNVDVFFEFHDAQEEAETKASDNAKNVIALAIQRYAQDETIERTVSTVTLTSEEMKGRIIGREGRNIKAIEQATGVDLIIDDTPDVITVSCFDPIRREIARQSLEILMKDGKAVGIEAAGKTGNKVTINAKSVVIATGGFGANNDMVVAQNHPELKGYITTNAAGAQGQGIVMQTCCIPTG